VKLGYTQSLTKIPEQRVQRHQFDYSYSAKDTYLVEEIDDVAVPRLSFGKKLKKFYKLNPPLTTSMTQSK
jgi:hypothetical protein